MNGGSLAGRAGASSAEQHDDDVALASMEDKLGSQCVGTACALLIWLHYHQLGVSLVVKQRPLKSYSWVRIPPPLSFLLDLLAKHS